MILPPSLPLVVSLSPCHSGASLAISQKLFMHFLSYKITMDWGEHRTEGWDIREVHVKVREKMTCKGVDVKF